MKRLLQHACNAALALAIVGVCNAPVEAAPAAPATPAAPVDKGVAAILDAFTLAFNAHNANTLSALWAEDAVYRVAATGAEIKGRAAIAAAYADLFKQQPGAKIKITVQNSQVEGKTATVVGMAEVTQPGKEPTRSLFNATFTRNIASWLLSSVDEGEIPSPDSVGVASLGWLAGSWSEELPAGKVMNQFHWVDGGAFMVRNYWREAKEGPAIQGTQIFGWDPEQACIRTWLFDSSGSFGEGYWQRQGQNTWVNKMAVKLPDGRRGSVSQILTHTDENELTLQSVDREIDGEAQPNTAAAKMTRVADQKGAK